MTAIIIDDEFLALEHLNNLLTAYCPTVEIVGKTSDAKEGMNLVRKHNPNILFLDIMMPTTGFDILDELKKKRNDSFNLIFTTGYQEHAIEALNNHAPMHYLLKPIDPTELIEAVQKVKVPLLPKPCKLVGIPTTTGVILVEREKIIMFEVEKNITFCYLIGYLKRCHCNKSLAEIEAILNDKNFFRIHRNFLININQIKEYDRKGNHITMNNNIKKATISDEKKKDFSHLFDTL